MRRLASQGIRRRSPPGVALLLLALLAGRGAFGAAAHRPFSTHTSSSCSSTSTALTSPETGIHSLGEWKL